MKTYTQEQPDKYKDGDLLEYTFDVTEDDTLKLKEIRKINNE